MSDDDVWSVVGDVSPASSLSHLLDPFEVATFKRDYYERRPLVIHREEPDRYADLLTLDDLDQILSLSDLRADFVRVVVDGVETPISELCASCVSSGRQHELELLYERYRGGSTVMLDFLDERWEPLTRFCRSLGSESNVIAWANLFLTPSGARGFRPHYDTHDAFILQVHGSKHWRIYESPVELPLSDQQYTEDRFELGEPVDEFDLHAGDLLYLPRGFIHEGASRDETSVHLTIGIFPFLWTRVLDDAVKTAIEQNAEFRRGLPIGFALHADVQREAETIAEKLLDTLRADLSPRRLIESLVVTTMADRRRPNLRNHLTDVESIDAIDLTTSVRRRPELQGLLVVNGDAVKLGFHGKTVQLPADVADEVRFVSESGKTGFTPAEIPGDLDPRSRLLLVQALVREGFLTLA